jgi:large subunit ribosomal protein L25
MTSFAITADIRDTNQKTSEIRKSRKVPGVVYGKTQEPISLVCDSSDFLRLYRKAGESNIIDLKVGKVELEVLVHQTQKHPVSGEFTHIDFYAITRGEKLTTKVHFNFIGESEAAKQGAIVEEMMKEIEVTCLPRNLVDHFDIDLSLLKEEGDVIRISDLKLDAEKYETTHGDEDAIASASAPKVVVEEEIEGEEVVTGSDEDVAEKAEEASE